jgi:hypothetical protein
MKASVRSFISGKEIVFPARWILDAFEERHFGTQKMAEIFSNRYFKVKQIMVRNNDISLRSAVVICMKMFI